MRFVNSRPYLYLEITVLMFALPLLFSTVLPIRYMLPALWLATLYCTVVYRRAMHLPERIGWRWDQVRWKTLWPMLMRFVFCSALLVTFTLHYKPDMFLNFVLQRPAFWALVMIAYPLVSVIPQEIIFRSFFFQRYTHLFPTTELMVLASGVLFGAAHLIFQNWVAPILCLIGGLIFARTYAQTRSLALVWIEHSLYGCMLFTVGLGRYFYHGAVGPQ